MTEKDKNWFARHKILSIVLAVVILGSIAGAASSNSSPTTPPVNTPTEQAAPKPKEEPKWDVEKVYTNIKDGMTKVEVEKALSKRSDNCSESSSEYIGKTEICTYGSLGDNGSITVTFQNDKVSSKAKTKF